VMPILTYNGLDHVRLLAERLDRSCLSAKLGESPLNASFAGMPTL
jgi:hypothetical protein